MRIIFNEKITKKEICESQKQCTRSTSVTHFCEIFTGQRDNEFYTQYTRPTNGTVLHTKRKPQ